MSDNIVKVNFKEDREKEDDCWAHTVMGGVDFAKIVIAMHAVDWRYGKGLEGITNPSINTPVTMCEVKEVAKRLLKSAIKMSRLDPNGSSCVSSGGFEAILEHGGLNLRFILEYSGITWEDLEASDDT